MEQIVIVNNEGVVRRFSFGKDLVEGENRAVELIVVYLPAKKQIVLFNRGSGATDMHNHWALNSGKVNVEDIYGFNGTVVGSKLPLEAYKNAAVREFSEELNFRISSNQLEFIDEFHMPSKQIYFTMLSLALDEDKLYKLAPDQSEVDKMRCFSLEEFEINAHLGDAIKFRKAQIIDYLGQKFK